MWVRRWHLRSRDARAEMLFWLPASATYADASGTQVQPREDGRAHTEAVRRGTRLALLMHDPSLCEHRDLLESVLAAAGLTIEIARLRVEVETQLARGRGLARAHRRGRLSSSGGGSSATSTTEPSSASSRSACICGALQRSLPPEAQIVGPALGRGGRRDRPRDRRAAAARGGHPPRAAGRGPGRRPRRPRPRRADARSTCDAERERLPASVEAAAYFVACEALTNAVKHASAVARGDHGAPRGRSARDLRAGRRHRRGQVATPAPASPGSTTASRRTAARSRIESSRGAGTLVEAVLPCAS